MFQIHRYIDLYALRVFPAETWLTVYRRLRVSSSLHRFDNSCSEFGSVTPHRHKKIRACSSRGLGEDYLGNSGSAKANDFLCDFLILRNDGFLNNAIVFNRFNVSALLLSPPGGTMVDGLPPVCNSASVGG